VTSVTSWLSSPLRKKGKEMSMIFFIFIIPLPNKKGPQLVTLITLITLELSQHSKYFRIFTTISTVINSSHVTLTPNPNLRGPPYQLIIKVFNSQQFLFRNNNFISIIRHFRAFCGLLVRHCDGFYYVLMNVMMFSGVYLRKRNKLDLI
jgi:hypothetical protein